MFYTDFLAYRDNGYSITGLPYRAIPFGPVPAEYGRLYLRLQDDGALLVEERNGKDDQYPEVYYPVVSFETDAFSGDELRILEFVAQLFHNKNTSELVRLSHEEPAWKDNETDRQLINYQRYAFEIGVGLPD